MPEEQVNVHFAKQAFSVKVFAMEFIRKSQKKQQPDAAFASIIYQSSLFSPGVADMLPVPDVDYSAVYIHSDVNKTHEFLFDSSHYRCMNIYQI